MEQSTIIVIGAGIGGIATAARLARHGYQITVVEKCQQAGGRCGRLVNDGHCFDTGPTLFLMPEIYAQTFADMGDHIEDHLDLRRVDPSYYIHYPDGSTLSLSSNLNTMQSQLEAIEPGSFGGYLRYLNEGHLHYKLSMKYLVKRNFCNLFEFCTPKNLYLVLKLKALAKHYDNIGHYFEDPRLKAAFTFQNMYMGLNPFEAPAIYSLLQYTELVDGVWFPMGGMYSVIEALTTIAEKWGVKFLYNTPVSRINASDQRVTGVTLTNGQQMQAATIIANADLPYVYRQLLPENGSSSRLEGKKFGCSAVIFYWGIDKQYPQLGPHNLFLGGDYHQSFDAIFRDLTVSDDPCFYIHAPVRMDPSLAPEGQDSLMVAIPAGHINTEIPQDWQAIKRRTRRVVIKRLAEIGIADLEEHIKFEICATPPDWQNKFNLARGSCHGLNHHLTQMGYLRPHNRHNRYKNLYFVGASTHPGTGLPTVLVSADLTTQRILQDSKKSQVVPAKLKSITSSKST